MRPKLSELLENLNTEIFRIEHIASVSKLDADSISRAAPASPSSSGDRYHAEQQAEINTERLNQYKALKSEIEESITKPLPTKIEPVCYFKFGYVNDIDTSKYDHYLANTAGFRTISVESPVGKAVLGHKVGDSITYTVNEKSMTIKIIEIA